MQPVRTGSVMSAGLGQRHPDQGQNAVCVLGERGKGRQAALHILRLHWAHLVGLFCLTVDQLRLRAFAQLLVSGSLFHLLLSVGYICGCKERTVAA